MLIVGGFELWTSITSHFLREIAMKFASNSSTIKIPTPNEQNSEFHAKWANTAWKSLLYSVLENRNKENEINHIWPTGKNKVQDLTFLKIEVLSLLELFRLLCSPNF